MIATSRTPSATAPEADSIAELIADCAHIPSAVRDGGALPPVPRTAPDWEVTEDCHAQVRDLDEYV